VKTADAHVHAGRECRAEYVGPAHRKTLAPCVLRAAVFAKASVVRILRQAQLLKVCKPAEKVLVGRKVWSARATYSSMFPPVLAPLVKLFSVPVFVGSAISLPSRKAAVVLIYGVVVPG